ncbi:MAG: protease inhibitor I42 family protein [Stackebrandtia sp.]
MRMRSGMAPAVILTLALGGCLDPESGELTEESEEPAASVPADAGIASVSVGETLRVEFGWINSSIGDSWHLVGAPDPSVLTEVGAEYTDHPDCEEGASGCDSGLAWDFETVAAGTTTVEFQYCYRSAPDDCVGAGLDENGEPAEPPPPEVLTVEVTD